MSASCVPLHVFKNGSLKRITVTPVLLLMDKTTIFYYNFRRGKEYFLLEKSLLEKTHKLIFGFM